MTLKIYYARNRILRIKRVYRKREAWLRFAGVL